MESTHGQFHCTEFLTLIYFAPQDYFTVDLKERKLVTDDDDAEENVTAAEGQIAADGINSSDDDHTLCEELEVSLSVEEKVCHVAYTFLRFLASGHQE